MHATKVKLGRAAAKGPGMSTVLYFLVWALAIAAMMRFGCGAHVMGHGGHRSRRPDLPGDEARPQPDKAIDPVCGMTVETKAARTSVHGGRVLYFCSNACREKFEASPASYPDRGGASAPSSEHGHAC